MQKLKLIKWIGLGCILFAIILAVIGAVTGLQVFPIIGVVILLCLIVCCLILYRCPHCGKFLGRRYGNAIQNKDGRPTCPYCNHTLD